MQIAGVENRGIRNSVEPFPYHVIPTYCKGVSAKECGWKIIKKIGIRYKVTFVDARGAKKLGLALKPDLIAAGINDVIDQTDGSIKNTRKK